MKSRSNTKHRKDRKKNRRQLQRRLRLESLETRELLAVDSFVVDTAVDENDGVGVGNGTSLREAIIAANADPDLTTITFDSALDGTPIAGSNLNISSHVVINGNGARNTTVDGGGASYVFRLTNSADATFNDMKITGGNWAGIESRGDLTVNRSTISGNGHGIEHGAYRSPGNPASLSITDSTLSGNNHGLNAFAYYYSTAPVSIKNTTISNNSGRGITLNNSYEGDLPVSIANSTISGNDNGIFAVNYPGYSHTVTLESTIVADNQTDLSRQSGTTFDVSNSLIENNSSLINGTSTNNITGVDPQLDPAGLQDNGGPTDTIALQPGSPAIDAGSNPLGLVNDQRGAGFPREDGGAADIGAVEAVVAPPDTTPPVLTAFARENPVTENTDADVLVFRASFDEDVANVDVADFAVDSLSTAAITAIAQVNASTYDVTVSGGDLADFNGTVGLNLAAGQDIADLFGNSLPAGEPATDETYTVANAPTDPADVLQGLIDEIDQLLDDGVFNSGQANSLIKKVENALKSLDKDNLGAAVNQLGALKNDINARVNSGTLSQAEADDLLEDIDLAIDLIEDL